MTNKKEITLQDLFNKMSEEFAGLKEKIAEISDCAKNAQTDDEKCSETKISDTDYITINRDGVFVGGKEATEYNGQNIWNLENLVLYFIQADATMKYEHNIGIKEIHCLQSSTDGEFAKTGEPIPDKDGTCAWCRVVFDDGRISPWVFGDGYGYASDCASFCAVYCASSLRVTDSDYRAVRVALFGSVGA